MGIPLIHTQQPQFLSTSNQSTDLNSLLEERRTIETRLDENAAVLDRNSCTMTTALLTHDGYPRNDIDVANVRIARASIVRLRNDHKEIERRIEKAVHEAFKNGSSTGSKSAGTSGVIDKPTANVHQEELKPFCIVDLVSENSPAAQAGIMKDDKVLQFGRANASNHENLQRMAVEVQQAITLKKSIKVTISRTHDGANLVLEKVLLPNVNWGGRGAIGFHCLPL